MTAVKNETVNQPWQKWHLVRFDTLPVFFTEDHLDRVLAFVATVCGHYRRRNFSITDRENSIHSV